MLTWVEISQQALLNNLRQFRDMAPDSMLAPVVKANAYGHGLLQTARILAEGGADWLCVNAVYEAKALREAGITQPLYVLGYVPPDQLESAVDLDLRLVAYDAGTARLLSAHAERKGKVVQLHVKVETGNNRQGLLPGQAVQLAGLINELPGIELEGISSHYADIEDTTDHSFARAQLRRFEETCLAMHSAGLQPRLRNFSNSAAAILWPETQFELVRVGISVYGMWPSKETLVSAEMLGRARLTLEPALTWKTRIAQVKEVPAGEFVGYGRTFQTTRRLRLAVLPVGYYDGYDRKMSSLGRVLIAGQLAPVLGRVCMNMIMADVTDVAGAKTGTEVVLLGRSGDMTITAEQIAQWTNTINYEVTTRINDRIPRIVVP